MVDFPADTNLQELPGGNHVLQSRVDKRPGTVPQVRNFGRLSQAVCLQITRNQKASVLFRIGRGGVDSRGQCSLGEVINLVKVDAAGHHQIPLHKQVLQGAFCRPGLPFSGLLPGMFKVFGHQRAFTVNPPEHHPNHPLITFEPVALISPCERMFAWQAVTKVPHRQVSRRVGPVFKDLLILQQLIQLTWFVARIAIPQRVVMSTLNDGYGVDLNIAKMFNRGESRVRCRTGLSCGWHSLGQQSQFSGLLDGE